MLAATWGSTPVNPFGMFSKNFNQILKIIITLVFLSAHNKNIFAIFAVFLVALSGLGVVSQCKQLSAGFMSKKPIFIGFGRSCYVDRSDS